MPTDITPFTEGKPYKPKIYCLIISLMRIEDKQAIQRAMVQYLFLYLTNHYVFIPLRLSAMVVP